MKGLGVFLLPLDGMLVHRRVTPSSKFPGTHLYTWVERGTMRVKCLAQEHNAVPWPGLEPGPPAPESSALTIRPPRLPQHKVTRSIIFLPPIWMLVHCKATHSIEVIDTHTLVARGTKKMKCLAQEHNAVSMGLESSTL